MAWMGHAMDHPRDTFCFLNVFTLKINITRDVRWTNRMIGSYGDNIEEVRNFFKKYGVKVINSDVLENISASTDRIEKTNTVTFMGNKDTDDEKERTRLVKN